MTSLLAPVRRFKAKTGELPHLSSAKSSVIFLKFCNPSFSQCQRKININHLFGNILTEVLVSLLNELLMKQTAGTVLL